MPHAWHVCTPMVLLYMVVHCMCKYSYGLCQERMSCPKGGEGTYNLRSPCGDTFRWLIRSWFHWMQHSWSTCQGSTKFKVWYSHTAGGGADLSDLPAIQCVHPLGRGLVASLFIAQLWEDRGLDHMTCHMTHTTSHDTFKISHDAPCHMTHPITQHTRQPIACNLCVHAHTCTHRLQALGLSFIHIWRCRRLLTCKSRYTAA